MILGHVMQSNESPCDSTTLDMGSPIFRTLDDGQMGLVLTDLVMMAHKWVEIPHLGQCTPGLITHWIEDVSPIDSWIP
jgi:hypothetical protein